MAPASKSSKLNGLEAPVPPMAAAEEELSWEKGSIREEGGKWEVGWNWELKPMKIGGEVESWGGKKVGSQPKSKALSKLLLKKEERRDLGGKREGMWCEEGSRGKRWG